jgi:hypothetical protein
MPPEALSALRSQDVREQYSNLTTDDRPAHPAPNNLKRWLTTAQAAALFPGQTEAAWRVGRCRSPEKYPPFVKLGSRVFYDALAIEKWAQEQMAQQRRRGA